MFLNELKRMKNQSYNFEVQQYIPIILCHRQLPYKSKTAPNIFSALSVTRFSIRPHNHRNDCNSLFRFIAYRY